MAVKPVAPTATTSETTQNSLTFPAQTFAKLSPAPFLLAHLDPDTSTRSPIRPNGRTPSDFRPPTAHTGSLTHASGSAVVRVGDTAAVCGVRAEILLASDVPGYQVAHTDARTNTSPSEPGDDATEVAEIGLLVPNIELSTGCSPAHLPGNPPSVLAQSLSARVLALLHASKMVRADHLRIWHRPPSAEDGDGDEEGAAPEVKAFWCLYLDVLFLSLDGNPFDAAWAAVVAALRDTRLPFAWWDVDREMILCDDAVARSRRLELRGVPVASTFGVFEPRQSGAGKRNERRAWILADPDTFEEGLCMECLTVVVDQSEQYVKVIKIEKSGGGVIGLKEMKDAVVLAGARWIEWQKVIAG